jgi:hypothetical protein
MTFAVYCLPEDQAEPICVGRADDPEVAALIFTKECETARNAVSEIGIACHVYLEKEGVTLLSKRFARSNVARSA